MDNPGKHGVFIVDDNAVIRQGLRLLLDLQPDLFVCGEAESVQTALVQIPPTKPDVCVIDLFLNDEQTDGLTLVRALRSNNAKLPLLVLSAHEEAIFARDALFAGAQGYIMKQDSRKHLVKAIHQVLTGKIYLSDNMSGGYTNV